MINTVIIIGKPGSGKSTMINKMKDFFAEDKKSFMLLSDRLELEDAVMRDIAGTRVAVDGSRVGEHSKLLADGNRGEKKFHILDGHLLNDVHEKMVKYAARERLGSQILLMEYAIGPDVHFGDKEPLLQSARHLVDSLHKNGILDTSFVIEVEADVAIRRRRNAQRSDSMDPETFQYFFPDGGEIDEQSAKRLGTRYVNILNREDDLAQYIETCSEIYSNQIHPHFPREGYLHREGSFLRKER